MKQLPVFLPRFQSSALVTTCLLLAVGLVLGLMVTPGPVCGEDLALITTRAGEVRLMADKKLRLVLLEEKLLYQGTDFMSIPRTFQRPAYDALLIKDFTGPVYCPVRYYLLTFRRKNRTWLSPPFGHCSVRPEIKTKGNKITFHFKAFGDMVASTLVFDGQNLYFDD